MNKHFFIARRTRGKPMPGIILSLLLVLFLSVPFAVAIGEDISQPETNLSPTTGLPTDKPYRPMFVIITNATGQCRPPWNLVEADIVYETIIWGPMHTRYSSIFNDNHPTKVGGLRSARYYHEIIRAEWDCPFITYGTKQSS